MKISFIHVNQECSVTMGHDKPKICLIYNIEISDLIS